MTFPLHAVLAGALALAAAAPAGAQGPSVTPSPARPSQGQVVTITVRDARVASATLAGEPVHFGGTTSRASAIAAIPIDAKDSLPLRMLLASGDSLVHWIRVRAGTWPVERLRVAVRYGSKPDSALEARTDEEMHRALEVSRRSHDTPRLWTPGFVRPRPGRVTSGFGKGREYNGELTSRHMGTDFAGATGTPVKATNRGVVALVDTFYYGGRVIYVDHGEGLVSAYMHLSRADVAVGDTVAKGQVIGRVGATGRVTGPHLHWVVRYGAITVDPLSLPRLAPAAARSRPAKAPPAARRPR